MTTDGLCKHGPSDHDTTGCTKCREVDELHGIAEGCGWTPQAFEQYATVEEAQKAHDEGYPPDGTNWGRGLA